MGKGENPSKSASKSPICTIPLFTQFTIVTVKFNLLHNFTQQFLVVDAVYFIKWRGIWLEVFRGETKCRRTDKFISEIIRLKYLRKP